MFYFKDNVVIKKPGFYEGEKGLVVEETSITGTEDISYYVKLDADNLKSDTEIANEFRYVRFLASELELTK